MDKNKIAGYVAVALASSAVTFGTSWFFLDYCRRDEIELGKKMSPVFDCVEMLEKANYPMNDADPVRAAIQGYLSALSNDKYTKYTISEDEIDSMTTYVNTSGTAIASGFQIDCSDDGNILIAEISPGLAADKQGLKEGDKITAIDGVNVKEAGYENIANKLLGKQDTHVSLTIMRDGKENEVDFVRDHDYMNVCTHEKIGEVDYIVIKTFTDLTKGQYYEAVEASGDMVIIDLRDNSGGNTEAGEYIAAESCGKCTVYKHPYNGKDFIEECEMPAMMTGKKIVLLTNEKTASTAEIFVATLKQELDATIVGTTTLGKGVYQMANLLENGDVFKFTAGTYTVGDWECYQDVGIAPDVEVPMDSELIGTDEDIQLKKALELLD